MTLVLSKASARSLGIEIGTRGNKFHAERVNGFDSRKEARRYQELLHLQAAKELSDVRRQPEFHVWINGRLVCRYVGDFYFVNRDGAMVIEDVKSPITRRLPAYRIKRKLVEAVFGVEVVES